jgi:hypothetical protein
MFFVPGFIIALATFPGVIVHELAHQFFCRLLRVAVLDVCYFRLGNPAGYVIHEHPKTPGQQILIGIGPFFLNTILGALIALPASIPVIKFGSGSPLDYLLMWTGISIAMHCFPSVGDAQGIWEAVKKRETLIPVKVLGTPIVGLIYLCAAGSVIWLDLVYGIGVTTVIPSLIVRLLA